LHHRRLVSADTADTEQTCSSNSTAAWHTIATVTAQLHTTVVTTYTDKPLTTLTHEQLMHVKCTKVALVYRVRAYNTIGHSPYTVASPPIHIHDHIMTSTLNKRSDMHDTIDTTDDDQTLCNSDNYSGIDSNHDVVDDTDATNNDSGAKLDVLGISSFGQLKLDAIFAAKHKAYCSTQQRNTATITSADDAPDIPTAVDTVHTTDGVNTTTTTNSTSTDIAHQRGMSSAAVAAAELNNSINATASAIAIADVKANDDDINVAVPNDEAILIDSMTSYTADMQELEYMMYGSTSGSSTAKAYSTQDSTAAAYNDDSSLTIDDTGNDRNDSTLSEYDYVSNLMMFQDEFLQFDSSVRIDNKHHSVSSDGRSKQYTSKK
jgi:hypothetical protein